ncbi:MAG: L-ribulose-5-phosphate 4-epimerase AraD [Candidatus Humimicrobiaceae bacterium]|jgi:L-ribulose-5-phosphate 4-epimerase|nr:L-ribulose-5-phosphate 4-epimerase AraD [Actinomycetota bacterium]MDY0027857.1 L-ribulose-5-phosphate 4-epimerase AraD [Candidatus Humimicrobiaceae bacterium]
MSIERLRKEVCRANIKLYRSGLVAATFGNVSGIDRDRSLVAIKPSGVSYESLTYRDIVVLNLDGVKIEGRLNPSSDTKTHLELYKNFPGIGGIAHTHSTFATAWAQSCKPIPCLGTTHADFFYGEIPCTDVISDSSIKGDYELETGKLIVNTFKTRDYNSIKAVLVACHGPFSWGVSADEAVEMSIALEDIARTAMFTMIINPQSLNIKKSLLDKHYLRKHGKNAYYGQKNN